MFPNRMWCFTARRRRFNFLNVTFLSKMMFGHPFVLHICSMVILKLFFSRACKILMICLSPRAVRFGIRYMTSRSCIHNMWQKSKNESRKSTGSSPWGMVTGELACLAWIYAAFSTANQWSICVWYLSSTFLYMLSKSETGLNKQDSFCHAHIYKILKTTILENICIII